MPRTIPRWSVDEGDVSTIFKNFGLQKVVTIRAAFNYGVSTLGHNVLDTNEYVAISCCLFVESLCKQMDHLMTGLKCLTNRLKAVIDCCSS